LISAPGGYLKVATGVCVCVCVWVCGCSVFCFFSCEKKFVCGVGGCVVRCVCLCVCVLCIVLLLVKTKLCVCVCVCVVSSCTIDLCSFYGIQLCVCVFESSFQCLTGQRGIHSRCEEPP